MSDNFRTVECLYRPTHFFTIYDYTKIAYLAGNYLCIREVVTSDIRPNFIKISDQPDQKQNNRSIGLISFPNLLVLGMKSLTRDVILRFYSLHHQEEIKIHSQLAKRADSEQELKYEMHHSAEHIYLAIYRDGDCEIIVLNVVQRKVIARGFIGGDIIELQINQTQHAKKFSLYSKQSKQLIVFQLTNSKSQEYSHRIIQKRKIPMNKETCYIWCKEELIIATNSDIKIYLQGKEIQQITGLKSIKMLKQIAGGFMVLVGNNLRLYKKTANVFDFRGEYSLQSMPTSEIKLSPQQDMIAFYNQKAQAIYYSLNWQLSEHSNRVHRIKLSAIQSKRQDNIKTFNSEQPLFVVTSGCNISIYSPISYQCYLSMRANVRQIKNMNEVAKKLMRSSSLVSEKMLNQLSEGQPIETAGLHPNKPIIGIVFKNIIRVYYIMYNEFKLIKQIQLSHCRELGFNRAGSIMYAKLGGKQGSKIYIYNLLHNFQCLEILNTARPINQIIWSSFDTAIYAIHSNGYYCWTLQSSFKQRYDSNLQLSFAIKGAEILQSNIILWGQSNVLQVDMNHNIFESYKINNQIQSLLVQSNQIVFNTSKGDVYRCKGLSNMDAAMVGPGFKIESGSRIYRVKGNTVLSLNSQGDILCLQWGGQDKSALEVVSIERKKLVKFQQAYTKYEEEIILMQEQMQLKLEMLKEEFSRMQKQRSQYFQKELSDRQQRYISIRDEKIRMEEIMQQNMEIKEQETLQYVKELERIYDRKIAIITNKLLTSQQMGFRNNLLAKENLNELQTKHSYDIEKIRNEYGKALNNQVSSFSDAKQQVLNLKKQYETRLSQLEQQNQELLRRFQNNNESSLVGLKKNVVNLQLKFSEAVSQKYNLQKNFESQRMLMGQLYAKNDYLSQKVQEECRRSQQLTKQTKRMELLLIQKDNMIFSLQARIQQLQKSNEIFKYRIVEMKSVNDPKQQQIIKLKDNMIQLQEQYEKIAKKTHQHQQTISLLKKDNMQLKNSLNSIRNRQLKLDKNYSFLIDRLRDTTKSPIQQIRKLLLKLLQQCQRPSDVKERVIDHYEDSPLEELNRVREHLEVCLKDAVDTGKKTEKQKELQIKKKNKENSQLLKEINELRIKVYDLQGKLKQRDLQLQQIKRDGRPTTSATKPHIERSSTDFETELGRNKTRESFFQKSLFRGHWRQKRLKTETGSRKKSTQSFVRNQTNVLYIQQKSEEVQELKRVLQQKQTIIKQLINKIHKLS